MRIIYIDTFKGGVGKTTTARFLSQSLASLDPSVVASGLSQQNDLFGSLPGKVNGLREYLTKGFPITTLPVTSGLSYIPGGTDYVDTTDHHSHDLSHFIDAVSKTGVKWLVIDGIHFMQPIAMRIMELADYHIIPMTCEPEAVKAGLTVLGSAKGRSLLLLTMVPSPSRCSATQRDILTLLPQAYDPFLAKTRIRMSIQRSNSSDDDLPVRGHLSSPRLIEDYTALAQEILEMEKNNA